MSSNEYTGKTLILKYNSTREWRVTIGGGHDNIGRAIETAMHQSGMSYDGKVIPESVRFEVEE